MEGGTELRHGHQAGQGMCGAWFQEQPANGARQQRPLEGVLPGAQELSGIPHGIVVKEEERVLKEDNLPAKYHPSTGIFTWN
ncbi:UNVERIFIED_CONTAM: hypothetical protein K2H54_037106 [Gekko kuhli]